MGVLFLGFCFPLWLFESVVTVCCLVGNPSIPLCLATGGFQAKCVSSYWELTYRKGDGLGVGAKEVHRKRDSGGVPLRSA